MADFKTFFFRVEVKKQRFKFFAPEIAPLTGVVAQTTNLNSISGLRIWISVFAVLVEV